MYHPTRYFLFVFVFFAAVFIIVCSFSCFIITNQKLKMMLLIIGSKHSQKQQKEKNMMCKRRAIEIDKRK